MPVFFIKRVVRKKKELLCPQRLSKEGAQRHFFAASLSSMRLNQLVPYKKALTDLTIFIVMLPELRSSAATRPSHFRLALGVNSIMPPRRDASFLLTGLMASVT